MRGGEAAQDGHSLLLLDGQQRLTTLYEAVFYLRVGNATRALPVNEVVRRVQTRWGRAT